MSDTSYSGQQGFLAQVNPGQYGPGGSYSPPLPAPIDNYGASRPDVSTSVPTTAGYLSAAQQYGLQQGTATGMVNAQPQILQNQSGINQALIGIGGAQANQALQSGYLNQNYGLQNAQNQLAMQGNNVDLAANARQPGYLTALHNIAGQQFDLTRQGEATNADVNRRALESSLTGRGAFTSVGGQQGRFDIANQLLQQTQGTNLQQQGEGVNFNEKMAQTADQKQQLDLKAKSLGITGDQLKASLEQGLGRLNLSTGTTVSSLLDNINSGTLQNASIAQKVMNDALQYSDYYQRSGLFQGDQTTGVTTGPGGVSIPYAPSVSERTARGVGAGGSAVTLR